MIQVSISLTPLDLFPIMNDILLRYKRENTMTSTNAPQAHAGTTVDHSALRVNQACIIALLIAAFLFNAPILVVIVAAVMLAGTIHPSLAAFQQLYRQILRPLQLIRPDAREEAGAPHRFAQGLGGAMLAIASAALAAGSAMLGWALVGIVIVLAAVNLFFGFCAGCFMYFQLARIQRR